MLMNILTENLKCKVTKDGNVNICVMTFTPLFDIHGESNVYNLLAEIEKQNNVKIDLLDKPKTLSKLLCENLYSN